MESVEKKDLRRDLERDQLKRQEFGERVQTKRATQMVYVDQAGIDNRQEYPYGYCEIGQRFHAAVFGGGIIPYAFKPSQVGETHACGSVGLPHVKQGNLLAPMTEQGVRQPRFG